MDFIIYHKNCPDGFTAAYIAKKRYPEAELMPLDHGLDGEQLRDLLNKCEGKNVIMVDYSLRTRHLNDELNSITKSFRILDHHKTAQAALEGATYATFDMERSGAGLAWDYLFGKDRPGYTPHGHTLPYKEEFVHDQSVYQVERPWYVNYVEDRDLWRFNLPNSREVNAFIMSHTYSIDNWDFIAKTELGEAVHNGIVLVRQNQKNVTEVAQQAQFGMWNGHRTAVVNAPYILASDVGEALYQKPDVDIAMVWFERNDNKIQISLRSGTSGPDVSVLATELGGGGHKHAAGISLTVGRGRDLIDKILGRIQIEQFYPDYLCKEPARNNA